MNKKYLYPALGLFIGIGIGAALPKKPEVQIKDRVVEKERVVRKIVRVTRPDGTVEETIRERETKDKKQSKVVTVTKDNRKWHISAAKGSLSHDNYELGVGYWVFENVAVQANYGTKARDISIGLLFKF